MSNELVDQIKFVRDMQKATSQGINGDIEGIVSEQMRSEFKRE